MPRDNERLFLLDGMALAYRAYFAFISRPLINSRGENTSAVYGFVTFLMKLLDEEKPDHVAVVFDTAEPTFRHTMYPEYKATRQKMPEDMSASIPRLKEVVQAFNVPLLEVPGFEADDVMGTLARRAEKEGVTTFLVTGDKDFMQLISPLVKIYRPGKAAGEAEVVDETGVAEKFGVTPDRVVDVLALTGDASDNVPGVRGIGEKTAIPLIQQFGSLEALYERLEEVPQKGAREKLRAGRESAAMSKKLVTIETAVPLSIDFHRLQSAPPDTARLLRLFDQLEFRSLAARLRELAVRAPASVGTQTDAFSPAGTEEPSAAAAPTAPRADITSDEHRYRLVTDVAELRDLAGALASAPILVVDTETTSTNAMQADLLGVSLCAKEREAFYIPVAPPEGSPWEGRGIPAGAALAALRPLLENPAVPKAGQNIEYDALVLKAHGVELSGIAFDTMVASYVLRADGQHGLDALAMEHFGYRMVSFEDLTGKGKAQVPLTGVPLERLADYSCEDADMTMRIMGVQRGKLRAMGLEELCSRVEFPLIPVIVAMEAAGVAVDTGHLAGMSRELEVQISALVAKVHELAGTPFNINSTQQLADVLFNRLGLPPVRKTKTGFSTDVNVLESLRHAHPVVDAMLEYRQLAKLKSTYVDALPGLINPRTGRVHASFNQTVAATGRLSSSDPNLQNIPIRTELGRAIRKAFVPGSPGWLLLSADYSQIELRVMAHVCDDPGLKEAFLRGEDIHATTAARVFGVAPGEVTPAMRRKAKEVNFGIMYGIGPFGLGNRLEISQAEARGIIERYFERFPGVHRYIEETKAEARKNGYVSTLLGRRRYLPEIASRNQNLRGNAERQAINMPIQGTAADMIKLAMVRLHDDLARGGKKSRMILQVHDELVFEVPEGEVEEMRELVARRMREALELSVPVVVDVGAGKNWLEAH